MKIGIYGGSFDPVHKGHAFIAKFVIDYLKLDKLIVIPVGIPSHKNNNLAEGKLRVEMCKKAFEKIKEVEVSSIEIKLKEVSYTYDTLLKIIEMYPNSQYYEIVGEDSGENFKKWKKYKEILKLSKVVVLKRKGYKNENKDLIELESPYVDVSSTEIRKRVISGLSITGLVDPEVENIILKYDLYKKDKV